MTAFSRPIAIVAVSFASLVAVSSANALPAAKHIATAQSNLVTVSDRKDDGYRYNHRDDRRRNVVRAPFTRVESGRRTVVDAPFVHVYDGRHGTHVVAPFVDYWR